MSFSQKAGDFKQGPCLSVAALTKDHHGTWSISSAIIRKPMKSLGSSELVGHAMILPSQDDQVPEQTKK